MQSTAQFHFKSPQSFIRPNIINSDSPETENALSAMITYKNIKIIQSHQTVTQSKHHHINGDKWRNGEKGYYHTKNKTQQGAQCGPCPISMEYGIMI